MLKRSLISIFLCLSLINCGKSQRGTESIQIKGSDTMVNLNQAWIERFMEYNPDSFVAVTGGGSGTGIAALLNQTCNIAACSRKIETEEMDLAKSKGINPREFVVALDGIVVVVHPSNPIEKLTIAQISDIFTGKITNWKEVSGKDEEIVVLSREINSGTYIYFKEHVLGEGKEYTENALLLPSSQSVADEVAQNPKAIGYYGMGYISPHQKPIAVSNDKNGPFVTPTIENVMNGSYYISRPLLMYTNGEPIGVVKRFLDFILSEEGQAIVKDIDFVPVK